MDMVKSSVEKVGGKIIINSELGKGTQFTIVLPKVKSVLIVKSLLISMENEFYSVQLDDVKEVVRLDEFNKTQMLHQIQESLFIKHHDELIPLVVLKNTFRNSNITFEQIEKIVIIQNDNYIYGLVVDEIFDIEEIVLKKLSPFLSHSQYFSGVTFVGDGDISLILNIDGIGNHFSVSKNIESSDDFNLVQLNRNEVKNLHNNEFMLFSSIHFKNLAIKLNQIVRLEKFSIEDVQYSGSSAHVKYREGLLPLILADNFLKAEKDNTKEVSEYYRESVNVIVLKLNHNQIGLIVNEIEDIGISDDSINQDIVDRDEILGTIFIGEKTISILNLDMFEDEFVNSHGHKLRALDKSKAA